MKLGLLLGLFGGAGAGGAERAESRAGRGAAAGDADDDDDATEGGAGVKPEAAAVDEEEEDDDAAGAILSVRADPHVLVVGDPGLGKSQMLRAAALLAPRAVYVGGSTCTAAPTRSG